MSKVYLVPDWVTIIAGLVIHKDDKVLLGLRSARAEAGKWCLPTGLGAIRRDISDFLINNGIAAIKDPETYISQMDFRRQAAFKDPRGFAWAETKWYVDFPDKLQITWFAPLPPICELTNDKLLVKMYFSLEWQLAEPPFPAKTEWPFAEVRFFSREELGKVPVAFGCDKDLDQIFWKWRNND
jgi:hypothetical protein